MSLVRIVALMVKEAGESTAGELCDRLGGRKYTDEQIRRAVQNARERGLVQIKARRPVPGTRGRVSVYWAPLLKVAPKKPEPERVRPLASVWELAAERERPSVWPPAWEGESREYLLLGEDEEEAQAA